MTQPENKSTPRESDTFDPIAFDREVICEKLLDGLGQIRYELADLMELGQDDETQAHSRESLDLVHGGLIAVTQEALRVEQLILKEFQ